MKGILVIVAVLCGFLFGFGKLMDSAMADVTGAGSTTNTQSTSGSSASNTAITGGYHSEATTNYQDGSSSIQLQITAQQTITTLIQVINVLYPLHLRQVSLQCLKIFVL